MSKQNKFGTLGGVFIPSILTILGVIMYLRLPMIIGEAGLWATLGIIVIAHIISATTGLSVSSIATDKKVEVGGTYYMISRSLGLPIGGTLGIALFIGLSFSVSLYLIGFSESFLNYWGFENTINNIRLTGSIVLLVVTTVTFISTSLAIKTQYFIMAAILLSLLSIFFGDHNYTPTTPLFTNPTSTVSLMVLFGIFFPAVTGFEAGVSMSGDLKDPKKSIPMGSIMAILVGFVVYVGLAFFFAFTVSGEALTNDPQVLLNIALVPELVVAGIWGATLSSALGSILGAPRILQATALDRITPRFFSKGFGPTNEPRNALLLTFAIAEAGILIGELDVIARVVSIFFITTYGFLNISAAFEKWTSADFRPEFNVPMWISILGAVACTLVMIQLDFVAMIAAIVLLGLLFLYLKRKELSLESGDAWSGVWASLVKSGLTNLKKEKVHKRNWRPNIIMFSGNENSRQHMVTLGKAIAGKLGILSAFELVESESRMLAKSESNLHEEKNSIGYFQHRLACKNVYDGMDEISRVYGFSGIEPNTILMGWSKNEKSKAQFIKLAESFDYYNYNSLFLNYNAERKYGNNTTIDVWWSGKGRNLSLAKNLVRHINNAPTWKTSQVRILIINQHNEHEDSIYKKTKAIVDDYRLNAKVKVLNNGISKEPESVIIARESKNTDLTILGIPNQKFRDMNAHYEQINNMLELCGSSLVINASDTFEDHSVLQVVENVGADVKESHIVIPDISLTDFPEVNTDIEKIDTHGQLIINVLSKKLLQPVFSERRNILREINDRIIAVKKELAVIASSPDSYRKKRLISKLKNDTYFKVRHLISQRTTNNYFDEQTASLKETLKWYEDKLIENYNRYPETLTVVHPKSNFKSKSGDSIFLKAYKFRKYVFNSLFGAALTHNVKYRPLAKYYQLQNRWVFMQLFLDQVIKAEHGFYSDINDIIKKLSEDLNTIEYNIWEGIPLENLEISINDQLIELNKKLNDQQQVMTHFTARMQLEFRKNLQNMSRELTKIESSNNFKSRPKSHFDAAKTSIEQFPEDRQQRIQTQLNLISLDIGVSSLRARVEDIHERFIAYLKTLIQNKYIKVIDEAIHFIESGAFIAKNSKLKIEENIDVEISSAFDQVLSKMEKVTDSLPETLDIYAYNSKKEMLSVPLSRMAEYYFKAHYEAPVENLFQQFVDQLKRSILTTIDLMNLSQFNLENTENIDDKSSNQDVLNELKSKLKNEKQVVIEAIELLYSQSEKQIELAFDPISTAKIEYSATEFSENLRDYQSKKVINNIGDAFEYAKRKMEHWTTRLFYKRSSGILFAKKLKQHKKTISTTSQILDFQESVSPKSEILKTLPSYYIALFNGKSNIGRDFWIKRANDEAAYSRAYQRFESGYSGGLLLLGDRNTGKTAFSRQVTLQKKNSHVFTVFAPLHGDATALGLAQAIQLGTQLQGDVYQVLSQLPDNSTLIINDLELFWEHSDQGLEAINLLLQLIDDFGHRIFFMVNMNQHAFEVINSTTKLADRFIEIITMSPLESEELKELVLKRHRSSGLKLSLLHTTSELTELDQAKLFDTYFNYSHGNPGTALNGWLSNIKKVEKGSLQITKAHIPQSEILQNLHPDWFALLYEFVLHKRLTFDKIANVMSCDNASARSKVLALLRSGIIVEKASGIYHINTYMNPFLISAMRESKILN
uniref:hypothetical protein n=1 Tax=Fulvivirga sp. TaxID=1931237 RepID=UPI00404A79D8